MRFIYAPWLGMIKDGVWLRLAFAAYDSALSGRAINLK